MCKHCRLIVSSSNPSAHSIGAKNVICSQVVVLLLWCPHPTLGVDVDYDGYFECWMAAVCRLEWLSPVRIHGIILATEPHHYLGISHVCYVGLFVIDSSSTLSTIASKLWDCDTPKHASTTRGVSGQVTYCLWVSATFPSPFLPTDTFFDCVSKVSEAESPVNIPAFPGTSGDKIQSSACAGNHQTATFLLP